MKFSVMPDDFADDPRVSLKLKGMMLILGRFLDFRTGYGFPSQKKLAACAGVRVECVSLNLIKLAKLGYLDIEHGFGNRIEYRLKGGPLMLLSKADLGPRPCLPDSRKIANPDSRKIANPDSRKIANPTIIVQPHRTYIINNDVREALLLVLEKHGVRPDQRTEIVACRTEDEIRDWVRAVPFYIAETGGKLVKSEAAVLFWALRQSNGPNPRPLPQAFVKRAQLELAAANELHERGTDDDEQTAKKEPLTRADRLAHLPASLRKRVAGGSL